jgi:hypothetical protein
MLKGGNDIQIGSGVPPKFQKEFQVQKVKDYQVIDTVNELGKEYQFPEPIQKRFLDEKEEAKADLALLTEKTRIIYVF